MSNNFVEVKSDPAAHRLILDISVKKLIQGFLYDKTHDETDQYVKNFYLQAYQELKSLQNEEEIINDTIRKFIERLLSCKELKDSKLIPELSDQNLGEDTKRGIENRLLPTNQSISIEEKRIATFLYLSNRHKLKSGKIQIVSVGNELNFMDCIVTEDNAEDQRHTSKYWKDFYHLDKDLPSYQMAKKEFNLKETKPRFIKLEYLEEDNVKVGYLDTIVAAVILKKFLIPFFAEANAIATSDSKNNQQVFIEIDLVDLIKRNVPDKYNQFALNDNLCLLLRKLWDEEKNKFNKIKDLLIINTKPSSGGSPLGKR